MEESSDCQVKFYLYNPKSQITNGIRGLQNLYSVQYILQQVRSLK